MLRARRHVAVQPIRVNKPGSSIRSPLIRNPFSFPSFLESQDPIRKFNWKIQRARLLFPFNEIPVITEWNLYHIRKIIFLKDEWPRYIPRLSFSSIFIIKIYFEYICFCTETVFFKKDPLFILCFSSDFNYYSLDTINHVTVHSFLRMFSTKDRSSL